jgi:hypothetical protein
MKDMNKRIQIYLLLLNPAVRILQERQVCSKKIARKRG